MSTDVQNIQNLQGYMKCGEILKSPRESYQRTYVLKCFNCNEIYLLFEAFIFHIESHCKFTAIEHDASATEIQDEIQDITADERMHVGEGIDEQNVNVKVEDDSCVVQTSDPLIIVKPEDFCNDVCPSVKEELKFAPDDEIKKNVLKVKDKKENLTAFEDLYESDDSIDNLDKTEDYSDNSSDKELENSSDGSMFIDEDDDYENLKKSKNERKKYTKGQSAFITEFLKSKNNVSAFIACYKNQPSLWNTNFPFLRHRVKRQNILQQIAQELNEQHNMEITWNQVARAISYLCRKYSEDLKGINNEEEEKKYIPSWFFEDLHFLKPFIENNPIAKIDSHIPDLLPNQIIQILEIYKQFPHLWNTELIEYYCKNKTYAAKQEMLQLLETKMGLKLTEFILEDYFRTINNCFSRAKRFRTENKIKKNIDSSKQSESQEDYYEHMLFLYDHVGTFECSECRRPFKIPLLLKVHQTNDHGLEPPSCSVCKKEFRTADSYRSHAKRHMQDLNYVCKECDKKFLNAKELRIHMRNHTGAKPFCCEICGASFRHIQGFNNHHRRHIKKYLHTCTICNKGFYTKDHYKNHMNSHSNIRPHICNVCGKAFIAKKTLQQHETTHDDVRSHACMLCGKTFKLKSGVKLHMRTHGVAKDEEKSAFNKE